MDRSIAVSMKLVVLFGLGLTMASLHAQTATADEKAQSALSEQLYFALKNNNLTQAQNLISKGADASFGWAGLSHLLRAVEGKNIKHAEFLFKNGAKIATADPLSVALNNAIINRQIDMVRLLIDHGADVNRTNDQNMSPLFLAYGQGDTIIVKVLLEKGADINGKNGISDWTLAYVVMDKSDTAMMMYLIDRELDVNLKVVNDGTTALEKAVEMNLLTVARKLIEKGANVNKSSLSGTPLSAACTAGHLEMAKMLIDHGADIKIKIWPGTPILHVASAGGKAEIVKLLIARGADVSEWYGGATPLHRAVRKAHMGTVRALVECQADINAKSQDGIRPLDLAAAWVCKFGPGKKPKWGDEDLNRVKHGTRDISPEDIAVLRKTYLEIMQFLLDHGAVGTALEIASGTGDSTVVVLLIEHGLPLNGSPDDEYAPLHRAAKEGYLNIMEMLISKGADVNIKNKNGVTPLHFAAQNGQLNIATLLADKGAQVDAKSLIGTTPLHFAVEYGSLEIIKFLLEHGADANARREGRTPLDLTRNMPFSKVTAKQKADVVSLLRQYGGKTAKELSE